jgi:hypothetical protein
MRPQTSQFIIDEIMEMPEGFAKVARHPYGCRIAQRLLEHSPSTQVKELVENLLEHTVELSMHSFGNFVMQHLLEHGTGAQQRILLNMLEQNARVVGSTCHGIAVLSKAITLTEEEDQVRIARALLKEKGLIAIMARSRHGHVAVKLLLEELDGEDLEEAKAQLSEELTRLRVSRYGRSVVALLESLSSATHCE